MTRLAAIVDDAAVWVWNGFAWVLWLAAIVEVVRRPAVNFAHGWGSKLARVAAVVVLTWAVGGLFLPVGAAVILFGIRRRRQPPMAPPLPPAAPGHS